MMRATAVEYNQRYLLHGLIYTLGLAAPWHLPVWGFLRNGSSWFFAANWLAKPSYQNFAFDWDAILVGIVLFALSGALLRVWGAAYLGSVTVHRSGLEGDRVIADGPYRYTRNPLYLGTILHTVAIGMLMQPEAALLTLCLILVLQFRLVGREEAFLAGQMGEAYAEYRRLVPRWLPTPRPKVQAGTLRPHWGDGLLSEIYMVGAAFSFAVLGWTTGYSWEGSVLHVVQGLVISLGLALVARAFMKTR